MTEENNNGNNDSNQGDQQQMDQLKNISTDEIKPDESNEYQKTPKLIPAPLASAPPPPPPPPPPIAPIVQALPPPPLPPTVTAAVPQAPPRPSSIPTPPQMPQQQQQQQQFPSAVQPYQPMQNLYPTPMATMPTMPSMPFQMPVGMPMFQPQQIQQPQMPGFNPSFFINMATFMHKIQTATNKYQQQINTLVYEFQMNTLSSGNNNIQIPNFQPMTNNFSQMPGPTMYTSMAYPQQQIYQQQIPQNNSYSNPSPPAFTKFAPKPSQQNSKPMAPPNLLEEIQAAGGIEFLRRKKSNAKQQQQPV